jgi:hypothetical protein
VKRRRMRTQRSVIRVHTDPKAPAANLEAIGGSTLLAVGHATRRRPLVLRQRSLNETGYGPALRRQANGSAFQDWNDMVTRVQSIGEANAVKLSADGLTANGTTFTGAADLNRAEGSSTGESCCRWKHRRAAGATR